MHRLPLVAALILSLAPLAGCDDPPEEPAAVAEEAETPVPELTVAEVARRVAAGECTPIDANSAETRAEHGTLPGARLLTSSQQYDVDAELPADRAQALVFYCANERCSASDKAARRALSAGYASVHVMRAGITGWKDAGHDTAPAS